jgi:hypothetical protein
MTSNDDNIAEALRGLPTRPQRHVDQIESRARAIRLRRHGAVAGVVALAVGAIAVPVAGGLSTGTSNTVGPATTVTEGVGYCEEWSTSGYLTAEAYRPSDEVPDHLRLLWDEDTAPPPTSAGLTDHGNTEESVTGRKPADCVIPDREAQAEMNPWSVTRVFDITDGVVTRRVQLLGPIDERPDNGNTDRVLVSSAGPVEVGAPEHGSSDVSWPAGGGQYWLAWIRGPYTDDEIVSLAESVRHEGDVIEVEGWSALSPESTVRHGSDEPESIALHDGLAFNVVGEGLDLTVVEGPFPPDYLWTFTPDVGDKWVDVGGRPGLLHRDAGGGLQWITADGALVTLHASTSSNRERILDIASSVSPVPAGDQRLADVWQMGPDHD